ncbi:TolC family protein [Paraburkholderia edwinii]|nr:TolC family protein [Paraburkholderia edwinii]
MNVRTVSRRSGRRWGVVALCLWCGSPAAWAFDPLLTGSAVPATAAANMLGDGSASVCVFGALPSPLPLQDAVERALCSNPRTREAWAQVKVEAARVGQGRAAYLPNISASWQGVRDDQKTDIDNLPQFNSNFRNFLRTESVSLSWVLYDFGGREAALKSATELLAAAQANQQAVLDAAFAKVAKDYYAAQAAQGALAAAQQIEQTANDSVQAATARTNRGVAPITDQLQAQTQYAQAVVSLTKAEGDRQDALGVLANDMNLDPNAPITLPEVGEGVKPDQAFSGSIADLIDEAKRTHPNVRAAEARVEAALAKIRQTRAEGLPSVSLVAKYSRNNEPTTFEIGQPQLPTTGSEWYVGFQVTIPIFTGFLKTYQMREQQAKAELESDTLDETRQQVGLDVWTSYEALQTATHNLDNSAMLLDISNRSYAAAEHRYTVGVGSILELLNAQSALAGAKRQRIEALTDWRSARLQLAAKLGEIGMWSLPGE